MAVSQVSARDFQLAVDRSNLPSELTPVVDKLVGTLAALKHAFTREKQATADISHELRTPLASILNDSGPRPTQGSKSCRIS
jgi:signal transduction histidine kinase